MTKFSLSVVLSILATLPLCTACGASLISYNDEQPEDAVRSSAVTTFAGSVNVSDSPGFELSFESQTSAALVGERAFIAYRAGDPRFVDYLPSPSGKEDQRTCRGASELSYSVGNPSTNAYRRVRLDPPNDIAVLTGPIAAASSGESVFFSALASPLDLFQKRANDGECLRISGDPNSKYPRSLADAGALAGACILSLPSHQVSCLRKDDDIFEGGSLATTSRHVYAAYRNATRNDVALYRASLDGDFEELRMPDSTNVDGQVAVVAAGSLVTVATLRGTNLWLRTLDEESGVWAAPLHVNSDVNRAHVPARGGRPALAVANFALGALPGKEKTTLGVFWHRRVGSTQRTTLRGVLCDVATSLPCRWPKHLIIPNSSNNFLPTLASAAIRAEDGSISHRHLLSFWSDRGRRDGGVRLRLVEFDEHERSESWVSAAVQHPCPLVDESGKGDWGKADASFVIGQKTKSPVAYRSFADSSQAGCNSKSFRALHQHVSVLPIASF